jgi:hypothetical protein
VVAHAFNPSTWEAEAGGFLSSRPACLQSEFQDSQGYTEKPCLEKPKKKKKKKKKINSPVSLWPIQVLNSHTLLVATILENVATEHLGRPTEYPWNSDRKGTTLHGALRKASLRRL